MLLICSSVPQHAFSKPMESPTKCPSHCSVDWPRGRRTQLILMIIRNCFRLHWRICEASEENTQLIVISGYCMTLCEEETRVVVVNYSIPRMSKQ